MFLALRNSYVEVLIPSVYVFEGNIQIYKMLDGQSWIFCNTRTQIDKPDWNVRF